MNSLTEIPIITGPELFKIRVAVEPPFIPNLGEASDTDTSQRGTIRLHLTIKGMEVAISLRGHGLGYLPDPVAREFRAAVVLGELEEFKVFECKARIENADGAGQHGTTICLDLPQDSDHPEPRKVDAPPKDESLIRAYRHSAVADRQIDELIGIVKGVMADGIVTQDEVAFLLRWMEANRQAANLWPAKALYPRLAQAAAKGFMNLAEEGDMLDLLMKTVGGITAPHHGLPSNSTRLPLTVPFEPLIFESRAFCFTGSFHSGTRAWCHTQVADRRGRISGTINKKLDYLVIGDIGNEMWAHSTHGRKIEKAIEYNSSGACIAIVSEEHWYAHL